ncbi:MAG TPA: hypothetical protein VI197_15465 [Polyangiaceae bacterium]
MRFSEADRVKLLSLRFDPDAEPSYELLKSCLVWPDECPEGISREGYELLQDLWIVRGFLHKQVPRENWGFRTTRFEDVWAQALQDIAEWPGFKRLQLSKADAEYLQRSMRELTEDDF